MLASCGPEIRIHTWPKGTFLGGASFISVKDRLLISFQSMSWSHSGNKLLAIPTHENPVLLKANGNVYNGSFQKNKLLGLKPANVATFTKNLEWIAAFGYANGEVRLMDLISQKTIKVYPSLPSPVNLLRYTGNDNLLAAGCFSGQIFLYNSVGKITTGLCVPFSTSLNSMNFHPTRSDLLAACSKEGVIAIWDVSRTTLKFNVKSHSGSVNDFAFSSKEETLASIGVDRKLNIYDLRTKKLVFKSELNADLTAIACLKGTENFAIGTSNGFILNVDRRKPNLIKASFHAQMGAIKSLAFGSNYSDELHYTLNNASNPILRDVESSTAQISNLPSDNKTQACGDFSSSNFARIPGRPDMTKQKTVKNWIHQLNNTKLPGCQFISDFNLDSFKREIMIANREILTMFTKEMAKEFYRIRMNVSKEFCLMEQSNKKHWQEFEMTLFKLAKFEEEQAKKKKMNEMSEIQVSELTDSKQQESLYSSLKTKRSSYTQKDLDT